MKKFLFIVSTGFIFLLVSCSDKKESAAGGGMSEKAKKNLASSHIVADAIQTGDISKIDSAVASDFVNHTEKGEANRDSLKAMVNMMHSTSNDMKMETLREFADDDYVFSQTRFTGTSDGSMGPKGPYDMMEIQVIRFNSEGKAVEHWGYMEIAQMMKMMGGQQPPADHKMGEKKDTAKKSDSKM